ncbi:MAG: hypothetical protein GX593_01265 [Actinomycetales bacterium]|nr:hypothetical protein [Actinomycetales bacterium]
MDALTRAVLTTAAAISLAAAAYVSEWALIGVAALAVLVVALGWPALLDLPARLGSRFVVALSGLGALAVITFTDGEPFLRDLPVVLALAVLLSFVSELMRPDGRVRMVESVAGTVCGVLVVLAAAGWISAGRTVGGTSLVVVAAVALAVGTATSVVPFSPWLGLTVAVLASGAVAFGLAFVLPDVTPLAGGLIGVAVGVLGATLREVFDRMPTLSLRSAAAAAIVVPVTVTGTLVYVVGRLLVG